ncbi:MAG: hypothetical protein ACFFEJ_19395 [Candidatus Thorarchaeota archaeon]
MACNRKLVLFLFLILSMFCLSSTTAISAPTDVGVVEKNFKESGAMATQMLPDPDLDEEPDVEVVGGSGEPFAVYDINADTGDSFVVLNWSHTAGVHVDTNDLIYFYQEFDWEKETMPTDALVRLNFSISIGGEFTAVENNKAWGWFQGHMWLIDSSGNWIEVLVTDSYAATGPRSFRNDLNYFQVADAWRGMIENDEGYQDDPEDTLTVAVGLAPTDHFESDGAYTPWDNFTGYVALNVTYFEVIVVEYVAPDPSSHLTASFNQTWSQTIGDFYPGHEVASELVSVYFNDYVRVEDGSIYVLSSSRTDYELYQQYGLYTSYQFLQKYDSSLNLIWTQRNINRSQGISLTYHENYLYSAGFTFVDGGGRDSVVTKWTLDGQLVWQDVWDGGFYETAAAVVVDTDGSVYAIADHIDQVSGSISESMILKYDSSGNLLWNESYYYPVYENCRLVIHEGYLYALTSVMLCFDMNGEIQWEGTFVAHDWAFDGETFYAVTPYNGMTLIACDESGSALWNTSYNEELLGGLAEFFQTHDIAVKPNGNIVVLNFGTRYSSEFKLLEFNDAGVLIDVTSIGQDYWPYGTVLMNRLLYANNDQFYVGHIVPTEGGWVVGIETFGMERTAPALDIGFLLTIGVGAAAVIAIVLIIRLKR